MTFVFLKAAIVKVIIAKANIPKLITPRPIPLQPPINIDRTKIKMDRYKVHLDDFIRSLKIIRKIIKAAKLIRNPIPIGIITSKIPHLYLILYSMLQIILTEISYNKHIYHPKKALAIYVHFLRTSNIPDFHPLYRGW